MLQAGNLVNPAWQAAGSHIWSIVAEATKANRVARRAEIDVGKALNTDLACLTIVQGPKRHSHVDLLLGNDPWVTVKENGLVYTLDITKVMFSSGNVTEKARMAKLKCSGEVVVDLFAGIGYFTIPIAKHAHAARVHAIDWNHNAVKCLRKNVELNGVSDRVTVYEGDNRAMAQIVPNTADRVLLGLLPASDAAWPTAVAVMKREGGWMHVHGNVPQKERDAWGKFVAHTVQELAAQQVCACELRAWPFLELT